MNTGAPVVEQGVNPGNTAFAGVDTATGNVLSNDSDVDTGDTMTVQGVASGTPSGPLTGHVATVVAGTYGSVTVADDGSWTYTLDNGNAATQALTQGQHVTDVFTYTMHDAAGATASATLTIDVTGTNDVPTLADVNAGTLTDTAANDSFGNLMGTLHGNDIDNGETATLHYTALNADSQPVTTVAGLYGSLTVNTDGAYSYVADAHAVNALQVGSYTDTFTVQTTDAHSATGIATLTVDVTGANDAPAATPVELTAGTEDTIYTISASALLTGVTDVDSTSLSIASINLASGGGAIVDNNDGTWSYTPPLNYNGPISFNYTASDGSLTSSSTAALTLTAVNDAPVATAPATHYSATAQSDLALQNTGLAVSDVDGGNSIETATLSVGEGIITVGAGDSGITNISGNGTGSVSFSGTVAEIDALLGNGSGTVVYNDNAGTPSASTTLTLTVHDNGNAGGGGDLSASAGSTIDVTSAGAPTVSITVLTPAGVDFHSHAPLPSSPFTVRHPSRSSILTTTCRLSSMEATSPIAPAATSPALPAASSPRSMSSPPTAEPRWRISPASRSTPSPGC